MPEAAGIVPYISKVLNFPFIVAGKRKCQANGE
jgi:hypothetical protein